MRFVFRIRKLSDYRRLRVAFLGSAHQAVLEPIGETLQRPFVDAEFLPPGMAERFGVLPPDLPETAYLVPVPADRGFCASYVITGIPLEEEHDADRKMSVLFAAIARCVRRHNLEAGEPILSIGILGDFLCLDRVPARRLRGIIWDVLTRT